MKGLHMNIRSLIRSTAVKNGMWLYALQFFNTVIPLLTLPYITRVLGPEGYGEFTIAFNLIGYFQVVVEYGFAMSGARKASLAKSVDELHTTFTAIILARVLLFAICLVCAVAYIAIGQCTDIQIMCILWLLLIPLGSILQQTWLFQGLQRMQYITVSTVFARILSVTAIFLFVKEAADLPIYCVCYSITNLFMGLIGTAIAMLHLRIRVVAVTFSVVWSELKNGWYVFTSSLNSLVFSAFGVTVLGFASSADEVGVYGAIQKIPTIILMAWTPISQVLYPISSRRMTESYTDGRAFVKKVRKYIMPIFLLGAAVMALFPRFFVGVVLGNEYESHAYILIPLLAWLLAGIFNNFNGIQTLLAGGYSKAYGRCLQICVICTILLDIVLIGCLGLIGAALAPVLSEILLGVLLANEIRKIEALESHRQL